MKRNRSILVLWALILAAGCATPSALPSGAKKVGGGLQIDWNPPQVGTAILIETTTGKTIATKSVSPNSEFRFDVTSGSDGELLTAIFATMPTNAQFVLYFVPSPE